MEGVMTGDCHLTRKTKTKAQQTGRVFILKRQRPGDDVELCIKKKAQSNSGRWFVTDVRHKWPADAQSVRWV